MGKLRFYTNGNEKAGYRSMTGVIYARYSSDNQREEPIEGQIRENTAFAEKNGVVVGGHCIDGTNSRTKSRELDALGIFFSPRFTRVGAV